MSSLEKNPEVKGTAIKAAKPMAKVIPVIGIFLSKPPIFQMSCSWWQA